MALTAMFVGCLGILIVVVVAQYGDDPGSATDMPYMPGMAGGPSPSTNLAYVNSSPLALITILPFLFFFFFVDKV
ncbi:hypothetical protein EJD97_002033 [Solanum chilense]|uniref:Uncharacterized protein n=1 Tax=Solanum chilense TaxID=4083 RepID=A0A6N2CJQ8_SOLCI|nr:hypothetical protein EJD97_002033 [Solanum chilense]